MATAEQDWPWAYLMPIGILVIVLLARAGRSVGLDTWLARRFSLRERWWY